MDTTDPGLLLDALKFYRENFISSAYSTMGFTVVAVGWLITSKSAQDFIRSHRWLGLTSIVMIVITYIAYWRMSLGVQRASHDIAAALQGRMEDIVYKHYELSINGISGFILIQGLATAFVILLILSIIRELVKDETMDEAKSLSKRKKPGKKAN